MAFCVIGEGSVVYAFSNFFFQDKFFCSYVTFDAFVNFMKGNGDVEGV